MSSVDDSRSSPGQRIDEVGEFGLIERLRNRLGDRGREGDEVLLSIGDDAACIRDLPNRDRLLTNDIQIAGRHFIPAAMSASDIGSRCVTVCVSDVFAMGGRPDHLLISLGLPGNFLVSRAEELYDGVRTECEHWNCGVLGGNVARSDGPWFVDITVVGSVRRDGAVPRSGAQVGDTIWVSGFPGSSGIGLALVKMAIGQNDGGSLGSARSELRSFVEEHPWSTSFLNAYLRPQLRGEFALALGESSIATAMLDISDGWGADLRNLAVASSVQGAVRLADLPRSPHLLEACAKLGLDIERTLLSPSDDYEILWTAPPQLDSQVIELANSWSVPCTPIGRIEQGQGEVRLQDVPEARTSAEGWDHFSK